MKKKSLLILLVFETFLVSISLFVSQPNGELLHAPIFYEGFGEPTIEGVLSNDSLQNSSNPQNIILILQTSSECPEGYRPSEGDYSIDEVKEKLSVHRKQVKEFYQERNQASIEELNLESISKDISYSSYTPFIYLSIPENEFLEKYEFILSLRKLESVNAIYIRNVQETPSIELADAITASNGNYYIGNGIYDGTGIVIGILDAGIVSKNNANFDDTTVTIRFNLLNQINEHATTVASIAAGSSGVARDASILSAQKFGSYINEEGEWMIDHDVNIINMSIWDGVETNVGDYTSMAAYIDYIVRNTWVSFVGSSGNRGDADDMVTSPKTGFNVVTVGSTDNYGVLSNFSSFEENFDISKPTLVAPGEDYYVPNLGNEGDGTSYSSPLVAGTIALIMEKKPLIMLYPEAIIALITSTATTLSYTDFDTSGLEETVGTGLLNIGRALDNTGTVVTFTNSSDQIGSVIYSKSVYLLAGQTIRVSSVQLVNSDQSTTSKVTNYDLLLQYGASTVASSESTYNNIEFIEFTASVSGYYYIRYKQISAKKTTSTDFIGLQYIVITP
jgi:hypothetical protein